MPENWQVAFRQLEELIEDSKHKRKVIFLDELPWLDMPQSGFLRALEFFWNTFASACLAHIRQIKQALGIVGVKTRTSSWINTGEGRKNQIDLVIDRRDGVMATAGFNNF